MPTSPVRLDLGPTFASDMAEMLRISVEEPITKRGQGCPLPLFGTEGLRTGEADGILLPPFCDGLRTVGRKAHPYENVR